MTARSMAVDVKCLRQYFNRFDQKFDRKSLHEVQKFTTALKDENRRVTVLQAFKRVLPVVRGFDRSAALKFIAGSENLDASGRASRWEFFFDLPERRAKAAVEWVLPLDVDTDTCGQPLIESTLRPFPVPGSLFYRMVDEGSLLYRQLWGLWREEMKRQAALPFSFRDSDDVLQEFRQQGLDITIDEVALSAEASLNTKQCIWKAQTRHKTYRAAFQ